MNARESDRPVNTSPLVSVEALDRLTEEKRLEMSEEGENFFGEILGVPILAISIYVIVTHLDRVAPTIDRYLNVFQK